MSFTFTSHLWKTDVEIKPSETSCREEDKRKVSNKKYWKKGNPTREHDKMRLRDEKMDGRKDRISFYYGN